jgi:hypothetical protein
LEFSLEAETRTRRGFWIIGGNWFVAKVCLEVKLSGSGPVCISAFKCGRNFLHLYFSELYIFQDLEVVAAHRDQVQSISKGGKWTMKFVSKLVYGITLHAGKTPRTLILKW